MKEALFYKKLDEKKVHCHICPHNCIIVEGKKGKCSVRENQKGKLYSLVYGKLISTAIDPIEKKPLFHFMPGVKTLSIAAVGCNFNCLFCQNWEISQANPEDVPFSEFTPEQVVEMAKKNNCKAIAYTYTEPAMLYEFILDTSKLARKVGIKNIFISNGYINKEPAKKLFRYIDAANIDIKAFTEEFYKKYCGGKLKPILETLKLINSIGVHIELTNLILTGLNDDTVEIENMCRWIKDNLGEDIALHFSRSHPSYKMNDIQATSESILVKAYEIAKKAGLKYVYIGNIPDDRYNNTYCPKCGKIVLKREGFNLVENNIEENECRFCGEKIKGIF